ncbi:hypothetical protein AB4876_15040 [Zhongshania guokunii]|jgi:hypothetical protein|uniref:Uncharacterized protein n=1 Tax=Zhongshania guokunii TaxID=641783 RepID=A0ABV3U8J7_9GAMM
MAEPDDDDSVTEWVYSSAAYSAGAKIRDNAATTATTKRRTGAAIYH